MDTEPPRTALADLASVPDPDTADVAAVARWLAVKAIRRRALAASRPGGIPTADDSDLDAAYTAALHFARALDWVCGNPGHAAPARTERTAQEVATAIRDGDHDERLYVYCLAYGLDYDAVRSAAETEVAADRVRTDGACLADAGADDASPEPAADGVARWRKRPVVIEARQLTRENAAELWRWVVASVKRDGVRDITIDIDDGLTIDTLEGRMLAGFGDWIIRGVAGEFYPCKDSIFRETYEPAGSGTPEPRGSVSVLAAKLREAEAKLRAVGTVARNAVENASLTAMQRTDARVSAMGILAIIDGNGGTQERAS